MSDLCFAEAARRLAGMAGAAFGWSPEAFWRATPDELAPLVEAATGGAGDAGAPPDRATIARLMKEHPDG